MLIAPAPPSASAHMGPRTIAPSAPAPPRRSQRRHRRPCSPTTLPMVSRHGLPDTANKRQREDPVRTEIDPPDPFLFLEPPRETSPTSSKKPRLELLEHQPLFHHLGPGPPSAVAEFGLANFRSPSPTTSSSSATTTSTINCSSSNCPHTTHRLTNPHHELHHRNHPFHDKLHAALPDEVLVSIFRFIDHASRLARLRTVCKQWCKVIDETPDVWRAVSFKDSVFSRPVICEGRSLSLGARPGETAVTMAATSGNEWACFLKRVVFERRTLHAVTTPQPYASQLVSGERPVDARPFPPWVGDRPGGDGEWIAIHAARRSLPSGMGEEDADAANGDGLHGSDDGEAGGGLGRRNGLDVVELPRGAMVGIIHVRDAFRANEVGGASSAPKWIWQIDRAVSLKKPIRCAGFLGLWSISSFLTDLLVNAMHSQ